MNLNCPQCQSENTQKITAIVDAGTTSTKGRTSSTSVGVMGGSIGVGSSSGRISATSTTTLAQKLAEPEMKQGSVLVGMVGFAFLAWIPGFIYCEVMDVTRSSLSNTMWFWFALTMFAFYKFFWKDRAEKNRLYNENEYVELKKKWDNGFFCHRCEHTFVPK